MMDGVDPFFFFRPFNNALRPFPIFLLFLLQFFLLTYFFKLYNIYLSYANFSFFIFFCSRMDVLLIFLDNDMTALFWNIHGCRLLFCFYVYMCLFFFLGQLLYDGWASAGIFFFFAFAVPSQ